MSQRPKSRRLIFIGIILISLGITFSNTLESMPNSLQPVMVAVGGLFFIAGMHQKQKEKADPEEGQPD